MRATADAAGHVADKMDSGAVVMVRVTTNLPRAVELAVRLTTDESIGEVRLTLPAHFSHAPNLASPEQSGESAP